MSEALEELERVAETELDAERMRGQIKMELLDAQAGFARCLTSGLLRALCVLAALLLLVATSKPVECQEQITVESRDMKQSPNGENELSDTLKYLEKLEKLDQYWSEVARPR